MNKTQHQAKLFLDYFYSRQSACGFGVPDPSKNKFDQVTGKLLKAGMVYRTERRSFSDRDVQLHLSGKQSIVAIPGLEDGECKWAAVDLDLGRDFQGTAEIKDSKLPIEWFPSKSGGWHGFVFFALPQPIAKVRALLQWETRRLGFPHCEIFPKQVMAPIGNGINLPFFGSKEFPIYTAKFDPVFVENCWRPAMWPDVFEEEPKKDAGDSGDGYWGEDALLAMLSFYKETFEGFDFKPCRGGYAVPCPGFVGQWEDGSRHTSTPEMLTPDTIVFLKNAYPKFQCLHAHCSGECGSQKKTINDWRGYWDPFRLWSIDEWLDEQMETLDMETSRRINV